MHDLDAINAAISAGDQSMIPDGSVVEVDSSGWIKVDASSGDTVSKRLVGKVYFSGWDASTQSWSLEWKATLFTDGPLIWTILSGAFARLRLAIVSLPENAPPFSEWVRP